MRSTPRWFPIALLLATVLGAGLRLYDLGAPSLVSDELHTLRDVGNYASHPPLYKPKVLGYMPTALGLWLQGVSPVGIDPARFETWRGLGVTEARARLASAVLGVLAIPLLGWASLGLLGVRAAAILALLLALAPWHLYWSQFARFYTLQFLLYNLSLIFYFRATRERRASLLALAWLAFLLAFLTQPTALMLVAVFVADAVWARLRGRPLGIGPGGWALAAGALGLCALAFALPAPGAPGSWGAFLAQQSHSPLSYVAGVVFLVGPATAMVAAFGFLDLWRRDERLASYLALAAGGIVVGLAAIALVSYAGLRYAFVGLYAWLALAAVALAHLTEVAEPRVGRLVAAAPVALLATVMGLSNLDYFAAGAGFRPMWRQALAYVEAHRAPGEALATSYPRLARYYLGREEVGFPARDRDALASLERPTWMVVRVAQPMGGGARHWLDDAADLRASFDNRVLQPSFAMRVYYFAPRDFQQGRR